MRRALLFLLLLAPVLPAQQPAQQSTPPLAGIAHIALRVHSLSDSLTFYTALGFQQAFDLRRDNIPYESFLKINDHQFIELYPGTPANPAPAFLHVCFEGDDLAAIHDDYVSHGLTPTPVRKAGAGNLLFTMKGPAQPLGPNNTPIPQNLEYTQYQPGSLHSSDAGQHLGPDRIADRLLGVSLAFLDPAAARDFYLNSLSFKPLSGEPSFFHLPGVSGDQVEIVPATLGTHARFTLQTSSLARALRHLHHEHIATTKFGDSILFTDPDGNTILLQQR